MGTLQGLLVVEQRQLGLPGSPRAGLRRLREPGPAVKKDSVCHRTWSTCCVRVKPAEDRSAGGTRYSDFDLKFFQN